MFDTIAAHTSHQTMHVAFDTRLLAGHTVKHGKTEVETFTMTYSNLACTQVQ